jgi:predicted O-methyltransferase YrrM
MSWLGKLKIGARLRLLARGLRYVRLWPYAGIDGWLTPAEAIELYELARRLPGPQPVAVEIGSWQGRSSVVLARGLREKDQATLYCVDPFDSSGDAQSSAEYAARAAAADNPLRETFVQNLLRAGVRDVVEVLQGHSHQVAPGFERPIDLLFLDGDHSYEGVRRDFIDWAPKVQQGGFLCMHDVRHPVHQGPRRVVDELLATDPGWEVVRTVDSMLVARRRA